jgi:hypothetical protein
MASVEEQARVDAVNADRAAAQQARANAAFAARAADDQVRAKAAPAAEGAAEDAAAEKQALIDASWKELRFLDGRAYFWNTELNISTLDYPGVSVVKASEEEQARAYADREAEVKEEQARAKRDRKQARRDHKLETQAKRDRRTQA